MFFFGQATSQLGSGMAPVAVSFAVLRHGTVADVGFVAAAGATPVVIFLLAGGVIGDRFSRRMVMLTADILRTATQLILGVWILTGAPPLWAFMSLAALTGVGSAIFYPSMVGIMPQIVTNENLQQANALRGLSSSLAQIIGPSVAGIVVAVSNPGWAVVANGLSFLASVISLFLIRIAWTRSPHREPFVHQLRVGWGEFWSRTWLWVIVIEFAVVNALQNGSMDVLGPYVAKRWLGGAVAWGVALGIGGVGAIAGGVLMLRWRPSRPLLQATLTTIPFALPMFALAAHSPVWVLSAGMLVAGVGHATFGALWSTTMQREIPLHLLSRLSAYDMFGSLILVPGAMAVVGPIAQHVGTTATINVATVTLLALIGATLLVPSVWRVRDPDASGIATSSLAEVEP